MTNNDRHIKNSKESRQGDENVQERKCVGSVQLGTSVKIVYVVLMTGIVNINLTMWW